MKTSVPRCFVPAVAAFLFVLVSPAKAVPADTPGRVGDRLSVCVYCGASDSVDPKYAETARRLGEELARRGWTLVWGGSKTGLMGAVASGAKDNGGRVVGVLPEFIRRWEVAYGEADEMMVVTTMHERKMLLQVRSDAFVVLPGGLGTLDELADTLDLRQLGRHGKPIVLLNQDGYYDALLAFLGHSVAEKFSRGAVKEQLLVANNLEEVLEILEKTALPADASGGER